MKPVLVIFLIGIHFACLNKTYSQSDSLKDSNLNFILPDLKINQNEKGQKVTYKFKKEFNFLIVSGDSLRADSSQYYYSSPIADINWIKIKGKLVKHSSYKGAIMAGLIGGLAGGMLTAVYDNGSSKVIDVVWISLSTGFVAALLSGIISEGHENWSYEYIPLLNKDIKEKKAALLKELRKRNIEK